MLADLARWPAAPHEDPALHERLGRALRPAAVAARIDAVRAAPVDHRAEPERRRLRGLIGPYLALAVLPPAAPPSSARWLALARCRDPAERRTLHERWCEESAAARPARELRLAALERRARDAGARSLVELHALASPVDPGGVAASFERLAIAPLDDAVQAAVREHELGSRAVLLGAGHPADGPLLAACGDADPEASEPPTVPALRRVGAWLGADPDSGRIELGRDRSVPWPRIELPPGRAPRLTLGALEGPAALCCGVGRLARAVRAGFLAERHGAGARFGDPAFGVACEVLFARLVLNPVFLDAIGARWTDRVRSGLRLASALAPREAWAYLSLEVSCIEREIGGLGPAAMERVVRRATGRGATPDAWPGALAGRCDGAAVLRGTAYAVLLEERLLTRHGRGWFAAPAGPAALHEIWDAEPQTTAERMACELDLGTIDPTPVRDRCRP